MSNAITHDQWAEEASRDSVTFHHAYTRLGWDACIEHVMPRLVEVCVLLLDDYAHSESPSKMQGLRAHVMRARAALKGTE